MKTPEYLEIPINFADIIETIRIQPRAPEWHREVLTKLARYYQVEIDVLRSKIDKTPEYHSF